MLGWKDDSVLNVRAALPEVSGSVPSTTTFGPQESVIPVPGDLIPSPDLLDTRYSYVTHTQMQAKHVLCPVFFHLGASPALGLSCHPAGHRKHLVCWCYLSAAATSSFT